MTLFDAESAVIGGMLLDPQGYWRVADLLAADDFADERARDMFIVIADLAKRNAPADAVTIAERKPESAAYAIEVANSTPSAANIRAYAEIVVKDAVTRRVRSAGQRIAKLGGEDVLGEGQRILSACAPKYTGSVRHIREYLGESFARMQERSDATGLISGVASGLPELDELTAGWQRADLIVIAARPSVGKTALALQCALCAAADKHPVLFMSLEMTGSQLADRALSHIARVSSVSIREPNRMDEAEWSRVITASVALKSLPMMIDQSSRPSIEAVEARIRQADATDRLGLVVIDYLGLMKMPRAEKKTDAIGEITGRLKAIAKDMQVPIILLCQLNRGASDKTPDLASLRDSGDIEQDADVVAFLHRPDERNREAIEFILAKQRNGPTGRFMLASRMDVMRFEPMAGDAVSSDARHPSSTVKFTNKSTARAPASPEATSW